MIRINQSPLPDTGYFINSDYLLESKGNGKKYEFNNGKKGISNPKKVLKNKV
jgi:hypothetical protein